MSAPKPVGPSGLVIVDKPAGMTSHDVVARARKALGTRKVGHSGTLDPDATGVLVLGVGRATRLLQFLTGCDKRYAGECVLGVTTSTLDAAGEVTGRFDMAAVTDADVAAAAAGFVGDIHQIPPMVSAIKVGGRRLHELARAGVEVERAPRPVTIHSLETTPVAGQPGVHRLDVHCSSGTYVRTLAADLGAALGGGAHLRGLRRTAVGPYVLAEACPLDDLVLLPVLEGWRGRPTVQADDALAGAVRHGKVLPSDILGTADDGPWGIVADGDLVAVYAPHRDGMVKPALVLA